MADVWELKHCVRYFWEVIIPNRFDNRRQLMHFRATKPIFEMLYKEIYWLVQLSNLCWGSHKFFVTHREMYTVNVLPYLHVFLSDKKKYPPQSSEFFFINLHFHLAIFLFLMQYPIMCIKRMEFARCMRDFIPRCARVLPHWDHTSVGLPARSPVEVKVRCKL